MNRTYPVAFIYLPEGSYNVYELQYELECFIQRQKEQLEYSMKELNENPSA